MPPYSTATLDTKKKQYFHKLDYFKEILVLCICRGDIGSILVCVQLCNVHDAITNPLSREFGRTCINPIFAKILLGLDPFENF